MKPFNLSVISIFALSLLLASCSKKDSGTTTSSTTPTSTANYTGTGSITQGVGTVTTSNLFPAGQRVAGLGSISSTDAKSWIVPAEVNFTNTNFPFASDLYNAYVSGHGYTTTANATAALTGSDIVTIDATGTVYTAYVFGDNYFEFYINGVPVGKDPVPYTDFNSCIVRFKVNKPFTIAVKCVDWEENLGIGTEAQGSSAHHIGDGGFVAMIKDASGNVVGITNNTWKAQTYYTSPISDLSCLSESGGSRLSSGCSTSSGSATSYGIHWAIPSNWFASSYDDSAWPGATTFTNNTVGVDNKPSYTNFADVFDNSTHDASFIWSSNLLLDNVVLLRKTIQ